MKGLINIERGQSRFYGCARKSGTVPYAIFFIIVLAAMFFVPCAEIKAAEPPSEPILRIETGMHTSAIKRVGIDAENRYLATGADDKTVRVWDLSTGRLIKILRIPVGDGNEGKVYALAMSPDGRTIACAGWTGQQWDNMYASVYLFDRESGKLIKRISGLNATIFNLSYSKDGRYLAVTLWNIYGVKVYRTSDWSLAAEDTNYGSDSYGSDFDREGRLVTTSWDGYIRLYDRNFQLIAKTKSPGGGKPYGISFSPDGSKIVVGFNDTTKVDVVSGRDLSYLYSPNTTGVNNGNLAVVSWSADGRYIYAGGMYQKIFAGIWRFAMLRWGDEGRTAYIDMVASDNTILHMQPLRYGGIVYGAYDPAFGIFDAFNNRVIYNSASIADYRNSDATFSVSYDGSTVQFGYDVWGKSPARFSIPDRLLTIDPGYQNSGQLKLPVTSAPGLNITDWRDNHNPKVNGTPLKIKQYESSRSVAVSPDGNGILLGADWNLRLFDRNGYEKWSIPIPGVAWSVNISGNGKIALAAFGDGTIRWYRMSDGKELLAFFPHKDKKRWAIWTPSGYYDASPGADDIIGWHLNNGKESEAYFFPISKFRATYYRPDVVAKVFNTIDEVEAVRLANEESGRSRQEAAIQKMLPPVVTIVSPAENTTVSSADITVRYSVRMPSGEPITGVRALIDGRPASSQRGIQIVPKDKDVMEMKVTIPEKDVELSIVAENRFSVSDPATVRLKWRGAVKKEEFIIKPKLYVLAVGVSRYMDKSLKLEFAAKDAADFSTALMKQKSGIYRDVVIKTITDEKATKDEILDGLEWLQRETTSKDVAMVFIAGHGVNDPTGIYYFLPVNANIEKLKRTGLAFSDIKNTVASLAGKTVLFIDTCYSGNIMGSRRGATDITGVVNELASAENGAIVFAASTGNQYSLEDRAWGNGAFTKALVEGLSGKADYTGKGKITVNMLDLYLSERVKELTKGKQTPTTTKPSTVPDFPVAIRR